MLGGGHESVFISLDVNLCGTIGLWDRALKAVRHGEGWGELVAAVHAWFVAQGAFFHIEPFL